MRIYHADTSTFRSALALVKGRGQSAESAAAWSLLLWALRREFGMESMPGTAEDGNGKPYFPSRPDLHFSLSHTHGHVLCALSGSPVGADVQAVSEKDLKFAGKLMSARERELFTLHELWCLRESVYKLTGKGSLRTMPFDRDADGEIAPPFSGVVCRLYSGVPGCACAAAAYAPGQLPERPVEVPVYELQKGVVI